MFGGVARRMNAVAKERAGFGAGSRKVFLPIRAGWPALILVTCLSLGAGNEAAADCSACHPDKSAGRVVHAAVPMGCESCHGTQHDQETFSFPAGTPPMGLGVQPPELCLNCHDGGMFEGQTVHGPVAGGMCTSCHNPHAAEQEKLLIDRVPDLCTGCHDAAGFRGTSVHAPVKDGMCTLCHDAHASARPALLSEDPPELCYGCHDEKAFKGDAVHSPVAAGMCTTCHSPHASGEKALLRSASPVLCVQCHEQSMFRGKVVHSPVKKGACTRCHRPHAGSAAKLLVRPVPELCDDCHGAVRGRIKNAESVHGPVEGDGSCLSCHRPHASRERSLLDEVGADFCLSCHDRGLPGEGGRVILDMKQHLAKNMNHHGPVRSGKCRICHTPHSSRYHALLRARFPKAQYVGTSRGTYDLCFKCHPRELIGRTGESGFRNGEENLHWRHVNKSEQGRVCTFCHDVHASAGPKHILDQFRFGSWMPPINFEKTETGGRCSPGCHAPQGYDRVKPVQDVP